MELLDKWSKVDFAKTTSFMERVTLVEELLADIEQAISDILGDEEIEEPEPALDSSPYPEKSWLDEISELLAALYEREENLFKAPRERWSGLQSKKYSDLEELDLAELLKLCQTLLSAQKMENVLPLNAQFATLVEKCRQRVLAIIKKQEKKEYAWSVFFEHVRSKKEAIATFLVLLDLVFRKVLFLRERNGDYVLSTKDER